MVLHIHPVKRVSWSQDRLRQSYTYKLSQELRLSQGRSRWSCTYKLSKEHAGVKADQDGLALTSCQKSKFESIAHQDGLAHTDY